VILLAVTAALVGFIYKDRFLVKTGSETAEGSGGHGARFGLHANADRPVSILAGTAEAADVPVHLHGLGTIRAYNSATVGAQVTGRLVSVDFQEGKAVRKGDVLARIDPARYQAAYDQAVAKKAMNEAALANAVADLKRLETLTKSNYSSAQQMDAQRAKVEQLRAQVRQDQAAIDSARIDLEHTVVTAPIDGRTGIREIDPGNLVTPGDGGGIVTISQLQPISVLFTLPETYVSELIAAQAAGRVELTANVGGKIVGNGALEVIDNRIDQNTGTVRLKGVFPNEPVALWPGQFVNVRLHLKTLEGATVVPSAALQQGASGRFVYRIQPDNTVKLTPVEVAREDENQAVIASGVQPGERIAVSGFANLNDGSKVAIDEGRGRDGVPVSDADGREGSRGPTGSPPDRPIPGKQSLDAKPLKAAQRQTER
jgi:multidrug efflux system membrane fusion protein